MTRPLRSHFLPAILLAGSALLVSCGGTKADPPAGAGGAPGERIVPVQVRAVAEEPFVASIQIAGSVKAVEDAVVSTEEGGTVREWKVQKGQRVRKGDVLVVLNDDILRPMFEAAQAQYLIAEMNFTKQQKVYEDQGISEVQMKTSQYQRDGAKAQADIARARFERTRIKAPIDGIVDDRRFNEGELAPPGMPITRVVNLDRVKVAVNLPETFAGAVRPGTAVEVTVAARPGETFPGRVTFVSAAIQPDNRTVAVEALLQGTRGALKPDMIARVRIVETAERRALLVEEGLVQQLDQRTAVVYVEEGGRAQRRSVTLGGRSGSKVEVVAGLKPGDRLITSGTQNIHDGAMVEVTQ